MYATEKLTRDGRALLIREAEAEDAAAVLEYVNRICGETDYLTFGPGEFSLTLEEEVAYLETCRRSEQCLFLLALVEDRVVGVLTFQAGARSRVRHAGEFGVSVLRDYWSIGVGSALLDSLVEWAMDDGAIKKINLRVRADNERAIGLYERKGFMVEGRLSRAILLDGVYYDHLCMGRQIG